jgi:hypothetical protein
MPAKLFVNLPVKDLSRSEAFFTSLGLTFYGQTEDMASVIISKHTAAAAPTLAYEAAVMGPGNVLPDALLAVAQPTLVLSSPDPGGSGA